MRFNKKVVRKKWLNLGNSKNGLFAYAHRGLPQIKPLYLFTYNFI